MADHPRASERWDGSPHPVLGFFFAAFIFGAVMSALFAVMGVLSGWSWVPGVVFGMALGFVGAAMATVMQYREDKREGLYD